MYKRQDTDSDLLDILMSITDEGTPRFSADMITGMFISMMFAGHHTTSGTAAWTLIELLRHPDEMAKVTAELDELYADGTEVSFQAPVSYTHLRAHETVLDLVCRLLLEKKKQQQTHLATLQTHTHRQ